LPRIKGYILVREVCASPARGTGWLVDRLRDDREFGEEKVAMLRYKMYGLVIIIRDVAKIDVMLMNKIAK
jgi:hypothetical protein